MPRVVRRLLSMLVFATITFGFLELGVRIVHTFFFPLFEDKTALSTTHPLFHHWHQPKGHSRNRAPTREYDVPVRVNSHGMAGPEIPFEKPVGTIRVAVLGDSYVEGFTTTEDSTIAARLQQALDTDPARHVEVLDFGCSSFSPSLEYFQLVNLVSRFAPDRVVLLFHMTDVTDDWRYDHWRVDGAGGQPVAIDGTRTKSVLYRIAEASWALRAIVQTIGASQNAHRIHESADLTRTYEAMFKHVYSDRDSAAWALTFRYIGRIRDWSRRAGVPFLLACIPAGPQVEPAVRVSGERLTRLATGTRIESTKMQDVIARWCAANDVEFLDLLPAARAEHAKRPGEVLFFPLDQHFTGAGNQMAASAIAAALARQPGRQSGRP